MGRMIVEPDQFAALTRDPAVFGVVAFLIAENGPDANFMIADGLAKAKHWSRRIVPAARHAMLDIGLIECVRGPSMMRRIRPTKIGR